MEETFFEIFQSMSLEPVIDVMMRVPPLFVIDELLRIGLGLPDTPSPPTLHETISNVQHNDVSIPSFQLPNMSISSTQFANISTFEFAEIKETQSFLDCDHGQGYSMLTLKFLGSLMACLAALIMFMLKTKHLFATYMYLFSLTNIFASYLLNAEVMKRVISYSEQHDSQTILENILTLNFDWLMNFEPGQMVICNLVFQIIMGLKLCNFSLGFTRFPVKVLLFMSFLFPSALTLHHKMAGSMLHVPVFTTLLQLVACNSVLWYNFSSIVHILLRGYFYVRSFVNNYGLSPLIETEWSRLNVPRVLRVFWLLRVAEQLVRMLLGYHAEDTFTFYSVTRAVLVHGCETLPALLGMTSVVSFICHYIGCFFQWVLLTNDNDEKSFGTISAVLFYILALQTGLTGLDHEKRFVRLCKNFCLLFTAVLHFVHNLVNPLLMSLSASHNPTLHRHLRALGVCAFLITFATTLLGFLWSHCAISTWLFAVSIFSIEVIVKVLVSLAIYSLFLFVAYRTSFWDQLDDCVYLIRSFGNTVEFIFGIVLFVNGSCILIFESGGTVRAIMMCIHAYFNLWCEARAGWNVFMKRRNAVIKINSLPEASAEQLRLHDDVCAICYQEMYHAKITGCNHYFHGVCLRKWLYVQDRCPLCHDILYKSEAPPVKCVASQADQQAPPAEEQVEQWLVPS